MVCQTHSLWDVKQCVFLVIKITKDDFLQLQMPLPLSVCVWKAGSSWVGERVRPSCNLMDTTWHRDPFQQEGCDLTTCKLPQDLDWREI